MKKFTEKVIFFVKQIPKGKTMTYKQISTLAGSPDASRAVGTIMGKNTDPSVPCHRVIKSDGALGGYNKLQSDSKQEILRKEGFGID